MERVSDLSGNGGHLPNGWTETTIAEVLWPAEKRNPRKRGSGQFRYVDIETVDNGRQIITSPRLLDNSAAPSRARNEIRKGDVVFSLVRPYLKNIAVVPDDLDGEIASTAFFVCRPAPGIDSHYLHNYFCQESFINSIPTYGNSPPSGRDDEFPTLPVLVAPTNEQQRIVEKIEELLTDLDAGVAALERVREKLKAYRASVLKAAVEGRLTEQWRSDHPDVEPAETLLQRILAERRTRWIADQLDKWRAKQANKGWDKAKIAKAEPTERKKIEAKYKSPAEPDTTDLPELPPSWCWATVEQCSSLIQYGTSKKCSADSDVPVLRMGNICTDGGLDLSELRFLPKGHGEFPSLLLLAGDVLFNRTNSAELVGKTAVYEGTPLPCSFASYLIRVRLLPGMEPKLLAACLNSGFGRMWIKSVVNQTVGQANVNGTKLAALVFPLPPLVEQAEIVSLIDERVSVITATEQAADRQLRRAARLRQSILKRAFEGKLVPQDPNDEPAEKLLDRIRQQREAEAAKGKRAKKKRKKAKKVKA